MKPRYKEIYLDANATTPVLPQAMAAAHRAMTECFGNPSSTHCAGLRARALVDKVRRDAAHLLGARHGRIIFTSGATESIQTAVLSALCELRARGNPADALLLYGATEHKAVPHSLAHWNRMLGLNCRIEAIPVDARGRHDLAFLRRHAARAGLVCTMAANNETGVISDLDGIGKVISAEVRRPLWLVDGVQALGKLPLDLERSDIDYAAFSGHKLYAPKGIGLLYARESAPLTPLIAGGGQESGLRSGTENVAGIAALGAILDALKQGAVFRGHATLHTFRARLIAALTEALPSLAFNTPFDIALPTTLNFSVPGLSAKELLDLFDAAGIRVSAGSACSVGKAEPSAVLQAMGFSDERASAAIRLSCGPATTAEDIDAACARIRECGAALRRSGRLAPTPQADARPIRESNSICGAADAAEERQTDIDPGMLSVFLRNRPNALLIDVRESFEQAVAGQPDMGAEFVSAPLSRLDEYIDGWLDFATRRPLVFFCRSGARSRLAANCLRRLGHEDAWSLAGGVALAGEHGVSLV